MEKLSTIGQLEWLRNNILSRRQEGIVEVHVCMTGCRAYGAAGGRWQWYRDGDAIAYLDVNYHLSSLEDVNNWLGRSESHR